MKKRIVMSSSPSRKDIISAIITNPKLNEEQKTILIEEFMEELKREYPDLKYHTTKGDLSETELKLTKEIKEIELKLSNEIENTRKEIKEIELKLSKEIENTRKEIKEIELKLSKEIENTRKEIKEIEFKLSNEIKEVELKLSKEIKEVELKLSNEIKETKFIMLKWQFIFWLSQIVVISGIGYKLLH
jgi:hypothetical protein